MKTRSKLVIAAASAAIVMALAVGTASANNLSISHGSLWRTVFRPLSYDSGGALAIACSVTLEGSFHTTTIRKVERALVGHITHSSVGPCSAGSATTLLETLPWHVQYLGFRGILPDITGVRLILVGNAFQIHDRIFGQTCLTRTSETNPAGGIAELELGNENRLVTKLVAEETRRIPCGILSGEFAGTATVTEVPGGSANLLVKLI